MVWCVIIFFRKLFKVLRSCEYKLWKKKANWEILYISRDVEFFFYIVHCIDYKYSSSYWKTVLEVFEQQCLRGRPLNSLPGPLTIHLKVAYCQKHHSEHFLLHYFSKNFSVFRYYWSEFRSSDPLKPLIT